MLNRNVRSLNSKTILPLVVFLTINFFTNVRAPKPVKYASNFCGLKDFFCNMNEQRGKPFRMWFDDDEVVDWLLLKGQAAAQNSGSCQTFPPILAAERLNVINFSRTFQNLNHQRWLKRHQTSFAYILLTFWNDIPDKPSLYIQIVLFSAVGQLFCHKTLSGLMCLIQNERSVVFSTTSIHVNMCMLENYLLALIVLVCYYRSAGKPLFEI